MKIKIRKRIPLAGKSGPHMDKAKHKTKFLEQGS